MKAILLIFTALALATPAAAQSVSVENFIGTITVKSGSELSVKGADSDTYDLSRDALSIDGAEDVRNLSCYSKSNGVVEIRKGGWRSKNKSTLDEYPKLTITAPATTALTIRDSVVYGKFTNIADVDAKLPSCGKLDFADVSATFTVGISGSADVSARNVGEARLATSGSGDFEIDDADSLSFRSSGSGDLAIRDVNGPASTRTSGSGDIVIAMVADGLEHSSTGSGDLLLGRLDGPLDISTTGSGDIDIDEGDITALSARTTGSGDITIGGSVGNADIITTGSGDVSLARQDGMLSQRSRGSGNVTINGKRLKNKND